MAAFSSRSMSATCIVTWWRSRSHRSQNQRRDSSARPALDLDHQAPGVGRSVRRMRDERGQQAQLPFADDLLVPGAVHHVLEAHRAPEHVEDLVGGSTWNRDGHSPRTTIAVNCESSQITLFATGGSNVARFWSIHCHRLKATRPRTRSLRGGRAQTRHATSRAWARRRSVDPAGAPVDRCSRGSSDQRSSRPARPGPEIDERSSTHAAEWCAGRLCSITSEVSACEASSLQPVAVDRPEPRHVRAAVATRYLGGLAVSPRWSSRAECPSRFPRDPSDESSTCSGARCASSTWWTAPGTSRSSRRELCLLPALVRIRLTDRPTPGAWWSRSSAGPSRPSPLWFCDRCDRLLHQ